MSSLKHVPVCTEYILEEFGTYFSQNVCTRYILFHSLQVCSGYNWLLYVLVVTSTYQYMIFFLNLVVLVQLFFLSFLNGTSVYILTSSQYVLGVPDYIGHLPGPAGLLASDSGSSPHIEPNHTKEG